MSEKKGGATTTNALVDFLLNLYHRRIIGPANNWTISAPILRNEFQRYLIATPRGASMGKKFREQCKTIDIVILLRRESFIANETETQLHINSKLLLEFSEAKLKKFIASQQILEHDDDNENKTNQTVVSIGQSVQAMLLAYQGNRSQNRIKFSGDHNSCFICQRDYIKDVDFKAHVHEHSEKSNFFRLNYYANDPPALKLSYHICEITGNYRFYMETDCMGIVIERIVFVLPDIMYYIHKRQVPYTLPMNTVKHFDLQRYLFRQVEQPFVVIFHQKNTPHIQRIEQHHYVPWQKIENRQEIAYLPKLLKFQSTVPLKLYLPEQELRDVIHKKKPLNKLMPLCPKFKAYMMTKQSLSMENYCAVMNMLLHIEDVRTMKRYAKLEQCDVHLRSQSKSYTWRFDREVEPGLLGPMDEVILRPQNVEGQPATNSKTTRWQMMLCNTQSIAITDKDIKNKNNNNSNNNRSNNSNEQNNLQMFAGVVQRFYHGTVIFRCDNLKPATKYTMLFRPARHQLRYQFRAIELLGSIEKANMQRLLFPDPQIVERHDEVQNELVMKLNALRVVVDGTTSLKHDEEQALAVQRILNGAGNEAPYVIFGPPGTGKTATIASAIFELYQRQPSAKILVMSGSNYACDEITLRLLQLLGEPDSAAKAIVRICAQSYMDQVTDPDSLVTKYSNIQNNEHFMPSVKQMHEYRILICTLNIAGKLSLGGFGRDSKTGQAIYTHIFIDETQSSTEAETLMGVMPAMDSSTKLIIAGDPMQLGTFLDSKNEEHYGLGYSLMVRLLTLPAYKVDEKTGDYNRNNMIRLRNNYRSHHEIVAIFNELFYDNKLIAKAPAAQTSLGIKWHLAPNPDFPIIFHNVHGTMTKLRHSMSLVNIEEVNVIIDYLHRLLCFGIDGKPIAQSDIGIITPYKEQCTLVRDALYYRTWYEVMVGTVEAFQGLEKQIILVSFVRTKKPDGLKTKNKNMEKEYKKLGFLKNEHRINTILSRAKSLMLLIGDAGLLINSTPMSNVIQKCIDKKTLVGEAFDMPKVETDTESDENGKTAKK